VGGLIVISTPALSHLPDIASVPTLAPLVSEVTRSVVNISVHGRVKEEYHLYRDPLFRNFSMSRSNWNANFKRPARASSSTAGQFAARRS
jgi:hypothetical protein